MAEAHFRVNPRLASLLGENYRSTNEAIRELVDNAWDSGAENVSIGLPAPLTDQPIIVADDGCGMTEEELHNEYLVIAHDRVSRKGEKTPHKQRSARGRKGIGKFAGWVAADLMRVETNVAKPPKTARRSKTERVAADRKSQASLQKLPLDSIHAMRISQVDRRGPVAPMA